MVTFFLILFVYAICMFFNAFYASIIDEVYGINTPVNLVCYLGFIGTFVLFVVHCMVRDDVWIRPSQMSVFQRIYSDFKTKD